MKEANKPNQPTANLINVVLTEDKKSEVPDLDLLLECDCLDCQQPEANAMALTRSKAKLKPPIDWEDQKEIHDA